MEEGKEHQPAGEQEISLPALVESLLFVADEPVSVERLAAVLEQPVDQIDAALEILTDEYVNRGLRLQRKRQRVQIVTAPEAADYVRRFLGLELTSKLSPASLETMAIVAYRQPITRAQIEILRGVSSDSVLRTLVNRGLVAEQGRLDTVGRPILYGTTFEFLQQFGLTSLDQLPSLDGLLQESAHQPPADG